jgi:hypothetical protein
MHSDPTGGPERDSVVRQGAEQVDGGIGATVAAMTALLERPNVRAPAEQAGFWSLYGSTAGEDTRGNHVPDAQLAALMRQHGVTVIYTRDRDFRRYEGVDPRDPFSTGA